MKIRGLLRRLMGNLGLKQALVFVVFYTIEVWIIKQMFTEVELEALKHVTGTFGIRGSV